MRRGQAAIKSFVWIAGIAAVDDQAIGAFDYFNARAGSGLRNRAGSIGTFELASVS
jgi:hypothetical protein